MKSLKEKKILLVTFSDNADHQDITFGMFEEAVKTKNVWLMCTNKPRVPLVESNHIHHVKCPNRPGICRETFRLDILLKELIWIKKNKFDIILFETLHVWNLPIILLSGKTRVYQVIHDVIPHDSKITGKSVELMNRVVCKISNYIVLLNKKYVSSLIQKYNIDSNKIRTFEMVRRFPNYVSPMCDNKVLFFGRLNPYKGIRHLITIADRCPEISFSVVGKVDKQVDSDIYELKKRKNVTTKFGYITDEEMKEAFIKSDIVILPYESATQSGVVLDAYRFGRPVVAFNVGAICEQIVDGKTGYLVKRNDINAFVEKIKKLLVKDNTLRMSIQAYNYGLKKYSSMNAVKRIDELFNE